MRIERMRAVFVCMCACARDGARGGGWDVQGDCDGDGGRGSWIGVVGLVPLDSAGCGGAGGGFLKGWGWLLSGCGGGLWFCGVFFFFFFFVIFPRLTSQHPTQSTTHDRTVDRHPFLTNI
jgi:hypothetical protein